MVLSCDVIVLTWVTPLFLPEWGELMSVVMNVCFWVSFTLVDEGIGIPVEPEKRRYCIYSVYPHFSMNPLKNLLLYSVLGSILFRPSPPPPPSLFGICFMTSRRTRIISLVACYITTQLVTWGHKNTGRGTELIRLLLCKNSTCTWGRKSQMPNNLGGQGSVLFRNRYSGKCAYFTHTMRMGSFANRTK